MYFPILIEEHIKPYCIKHDCEFIAGNGRWWLGKEMHSEISEDVPERLVLYNILTEPIPGMLINDAGSKMPNYRRPNEHYNILRLEGRNKQAK